MAAEVIRLAKMNSTREVRFLLFSPAERSSIASLTRSALMVRDIPPSQPTYVDHPSHFRQPRFALLELCRWSRAPESIFLERDVPCCRWPATAHQHTRGCRIGGGSLHTFLNDVRVLEFFWRSMDCTRCTQVRTLNHLVETSGMQYLLLLKGAHRRASATVATSDPPTPTSPADPI